MTIRLFALGLRNPTLRPAVAELLRTARDRVAHTSERSGVEAARAQRMAPIQLTCFDGLALQHWRDPDFDLAGASATLEDLLFREPASKR